MKEKKENKEMEKWGKNKVNRENMIESPRLRVD